MQRVKVYRLNEQGQWDDKGTGHVSAEVMEVGWMPAQLPVCMHACQQWQQLTATLSQSRQYYPEYTGTQHTYAYWSWL